MNLAWEQDNKQHFCTISTSVPASRFLSWVHVSTSLVDGLWIVRRHELFSLQIAFNQCLMMAMKRKFKKKEIATAVETCCDRPDHMKCRPCNVFWEESDGFGSFGLQKPLNTKSSMDLCGNLGDNTETKPLSNAPLSICFCFLPKLLALSTFLDPLRWQAITGELS